MTAEPEPGHYRTRRSWLWRAALVRATCPHCSRSFTRRVRGGWAGGFFPLLSLFCPLCQLWNTYAPETRP